jgi:hypothetical protein
MGKSVADILSDVLPEVFDRFKESNAQERRLSPAQQQQSAQPSDAHQLQLNWDTT